MFVVESRTPLHRGMVFRLYVATEARAVEEAAKPFEERDPEHPVHVGATRSYRPIDFMSAPRKVRIASLASVIRAAHRRRRG